MNRENPRLEGGVKTAKEGWRRTAPGVKTKLGRAVGVKRSLDETPNGAEGRFQAVGRPVTNPFAAHASATVGERLEDAGISWQTCHNNEVQPYGMNSILGFKAFRDANAIRRPLESSGGWYDFSVRVTGQADDIRRFAGRLETGAPCITDPAMQGEAIGEQFRVVG